jgi:hypothetical protein
LTKSFEPKKEAAVIAGHESGLGMGNGLFVLFPRESKQLRDELLRFASR